MSEQTTTDLFAKQPQNIVEQAIAGELQPITQTIKEVPLTPELVTFLQTSGLPETKQKNIGDTLSYFFNKADEWSKLADGIVINDPSEVSKMKVARETRLGLKAMRGQAKSLLASKRDEVKNRMANDVLEDKLWLKAWQMIEATFNNIETKLEHKEKFAERYEAEQKENLRVRRVAELEPYSEVVQSAYIDLGTMDEEAYNNLFNGAKLQLKAKQDAEQKHKEEMEAIQKKVALSHTRQLEVAPYKQFFLPDMPTSLGEVSDADYVIILAALKDAKADYDIKQENIRKQNEELLQKQQEDAQKQKERQDLQAKRLEELLPYNRFGEQVNMATLWELPQEKYDIILMEKMILHKGEEMKAQLLASRVKEIEPYKQYATQKQIDELGDIDAETYQMWLGLLSQSKQEADDLLKSKQEEVARRVSLCYTLGLEYTGGVYSYKDVRFHINEIQSLTASEFDMAFAGAKNRMAQIKDEERIEAEAQKQEQLKNALPMSDKEILLNFAKELDELVLPIPTSPAGKKILEDAKVLLAKTSKFVKDKTEKL